MTTTTVALPRTPLLALRVTGLLLAGAGIVTLFVTNSVDAPPIWVGPIVFLTAATQIIGLLVALGSGVIALVRIRGV